SRQERVTEATDTVSVVVAARDVARGVVLTAEQLKTREFPKELVPPGAVTSIDDALDRVVLYALVNDEPILERKLSQKHAKGGLAALVPAGMRAVTIQTPNVAGGVAGFILPGNKVDVLLTMNQQSPNDASGGAVTTTLL